MTTTQPVPQYAPPPPQPLPESLSSGYNSYSPLSTLERQYAAPVGQRVHIFIRTNPNVYLAGGVEAILKKSNNNNNNPSTMSMASSNTFGTDTSLMTTTTTTTTTTSTSDTDSSANNNNNDNNTGTDPFSFLGGDDDAGDSSATNSAAASAGGANHNNNNNNNNNKKKLAGGGGGPNIGRFLKKVAHSTTKTLERGMTNLAIRADGGKSPDWLFLGLYDARTGAVLSLTESQAVPMDESKKFYGLRFQIPLTLPSNALSPSDAVLIRVWIRSGAAMLQQRHYLIGQVPLTVAQLRSSAATFATTNPNPNYSNFMTVTLQSNMVADGKLFLCVTPDSKFLTLCGPGWSLADPDPQVAYGGGTNGGAAGGGSLFYLPLDQAYGLSYPAAPSSSWLIATERSVESTVVLPIAAALSRLTAHAGRISWQHAESVSMRVHAARHDSTLGEYVDCTFTLGQVKLTPPPAMTTTLEPPKEAVTIFGSASWQRPDSIFEVDLLQPLRLHTTAPPTPPPSGDARMASTFRFFPKPIREGILPALLRESEGRLPSSGFLLGTVRLQFDISRPQSHHHHLHTSSAAVVDTWECLIGLEGLLVLQQQQQQSTSDESNKNTNTPTVMEFPIFDSARQQRATIAMTLAMKMKQGPPLPQRVEAKGGLLSLMGLNALCDSVPPDLDVVIPDANVGHPELLTRQQQQLGTMGICVTQGYTNYHCTAIRSRDVKELQERCTKYNEALVTPADHVLPHEVRTPKAFRPSSSRSELLLAGLPFNVHTASLSLHVSEQEPPSNGQPPRPESVFTNVTCGAPADHARGFGNIIPKSTKEMNLQAMGFISPVGAVTGGLRRLEAKRAQIAKCVSDLQMALTMNVANYFVEERQRKNMCNHVPSRHAEMQQLRWSLFEACQSLHHVTWHCAMRRSSVFSQALGIATTSFLATLSDPNKWQSTWPEFWAKHGYLVTFEGLLSAAGKELGMIEDASVGISMLRFVSIVFRSDDNQGDVHKVPIMASPYLKWIRLSASHSGLAGTTPEYTLEIGVVPSYYDQRIPKALHDGKSVRFYPLLFEVGVDIRQWGAHTGANMKSKLSKADSSADGSNTEQPAVSILDDEDDEGGFADDDVLVELNYEAFNKLNAYAHSISPANSATSATKTHPLLENLYRHIVNSKGKISHGILDEASALSQQLGGGGIVFCKSGKDRTAMHVTYKQAQYANKFRSRNPSSLSAVVSGEDGTPFDDQTTADATVMRIYGTRLPICEKNVGQAKYAFNSLQVKFMPDALKPPMNTLAGFLKGGKVFQGGGIES
ncbi:hypothetical protein ACA910_012922 [Epithemia clementina (nom. ined.)]